MWLALSTGSAAALLPHRRTQRRILLAMYLHCTRTGNQKHIPLAVQLLCYRTGAVRYIPVVPTTAPVHYAVPLDRIPLTVQLLDDRIAASAERYH